MLFKIFKIGGLVLAIFLLVAVIAGIIAHEPLPQGAQPKKAEALTDSMLKALNLNAYSNIKTIEWAFPRGHRYRWDKKNNVVNVQWGDYEVNLNTVTQEGLAVKNGEPLWDEEKTAALLKAWRYFANDSFWLVAPYKIRDPGTTRTYLETSEGPGILVTYASGGVTPGDSYLWVLNDNYLPKKWKMWVGLVPIGGISFTWGNWEDFNGALLAKDHIGPFGYNVQIKEISVK